MQALLMTGAAWKNSNGGTASHQGVAARPYVSALPPQPGDRQPPLQRLPLYYRGVEASGPLDGGHGYRRPLHVRLRQLLVEQSAGQRRTSNLQSVKRTPDQRRLERVEGAKQAYLLWQTPYLLGGGTPGPSGYQSLRQGHPVGGGGVINGRE